MRPVVCQLWLLGGSEWLQQHQQRREDEHNGTATAAGKQRNRHKATKGVGTDAVYMDDRTAIRSSGTDVVQTCRDWKQWSETTRLQENLV